MDHVNTRDHNHHRSTYDNPVIQNEGQRLLIELRKPLQEVATLTGVTRAAVSRWRNGLTMPMMTYRIAIEGALGIPRNSWSLPPSVHDGRQTDIVGSVADTSKPDRTQYNGDEPPTVPYPAAPPEESPTIDHMRYNLQCIRHDLEYQKLTITSRSKLRSDEQRALVMIAKMEKEDELKEDRFVREHPEWRRLCDTILKALEPFPEASKAVHSAISDTE